MDNYRVQRHYGCGESERKSVAGRPGYETESRGLIAVRCGPPSGLNRIYKANRFMALRLTPVSMLDSLKPDGAAIRSIRTPPDVMEPVPNSPRRRPPRRGTAVRTLRALQEAQNHRNATLAGQQENRRGLSGGRQTSLSISQ